LTSYLFRFLLGENFQQGHLIANGKLHKVAMVATMRRLLLILNAIIKTKTPWRPPCPA
jgi:hypothetical protein